MAAPTALFVVAHECAHEALGHVLRGGARREEEEIAAACFDSPPPDLAPVPVPAGTFFVQPLQTNVIRAAGLSETSRN